MNSFFLNSGPHNINKIIDCFLFSSKEKLKNQKVKNISNLQDAQKGDLTFLENSKFLNDLSATKASYCLIDKKYIKYVNNSTIPIISEQPLLDFILAAKLFYPEADKDNYDFKQNLKYKNLTKNSTFIDASVKISSGFKIGINSTIKKNVIIGKNVSIGSNCVVSNSIIGDDVTINDGTVIGKIGFGFKYIKEKLYFIPHIGYVEIGNNVYIGSNCTIDRGSFSKTLVGKNTMIDNQVHIAHNVKIGSSCFITGQVGIAGSAFLGNHCMIGGQAGISGHLRIGNNVQIGGGSGVLKNLDDNAKVIGYPARSIKNFLKG